MCHGSLRERSSGRGVGTVRCRCDRILFPARPLLVQTISQCRIQGSPNGSFAARISQAVGGCSGASGINAADACNPIRRESSGHDHCTLRVRTVISAGGARRPALVDREFLMGNSAGLPSLPASLRGRPPQRGNGGVQVDIPAQGLFVRAPLR